jgi:hypothetical protein
MKSQSLPILILFVTGLTDDVFNIQVTATCTNYTGTSCTSLTQPGSIVEDYGACLPGNTELIAET